MLDDDFACRELAEVVREKLDAEDVLASKRHEQLFVSLVRNQKDRKRQKQKVRIGIGLVAVAAAAAIIFAVSLAITPGDLRFKVGNVANAFVPGEPGDWVQADMGEMIEIRFEQGSRFKIREGCAARVVESGEEAVTIELSQGDISANVKGNKKTRWRINAGPFTVTVLGTAFDVSWDAVTNAFDVKVNRGAVLVQGAGLSRHGVRLLAGQQLAANGRSGDVSLTSPNVSMAALDRASGDTGSGRSVKTELMLDDTATLSEALIQESRNVLPEKRSVKSRVVRASTQKWLAHYSDGRFADAVRAAEKQGLSEIYKTANAQTLWKLADAARNAHSVSISNDSLVALRLRFPSGKKAKLAAFIIGRSAMDISGNASVAAQWFQTYLTESPNGSMSEEVHGRLMTIYTRLNRQSAAKRIASQYVRRYPTGLYIDRAKRVLQ